jgi:hypothetical protein
MPPDPKLGPSVGSEVWNVETGSRSICLFVLAPGARGPFRHRGKVAMLDSE